MAKGFVGVPEKGPRDRKESKTATDLIAQLSEIDRAARQFGGTLYWVLSGNDVDKPPAGFRNRLYVAIDTTPKRIYLDNETSWLQIV